MVFHHSINPSPSPSPSPPSSPSPFRSTPPNAQPPPPSSPPPCSQAMLMMASSPAKLPTTNNLTFRRHLNHQQTPNRFRSGGLDSGVRIGPSPLNPANKMDIISSPENKPAEGSDASAEDNGKSKLFIRLSAKKRDLPPDSVPSFTEPDPHSDPEPETEPEPDLETEPESEPETEDEDEGDDSAEDDEPEEMVKTWNLRPRKPVAKPNPTPKPKPIPNPNPNPKPKPNPKPNTKEGAEGGGSRSGHRRRNGNGWTSRKNRGKGKVNKRNEEKEKEKEKGLVLSLTLSKEEIEEDFINMTDAKPPKKPKRRPRAVQKQLDVVTLSLFLPSMPSLFFI